MADDNHGVDDEYVEETGCTWRKRKHARVLCAIIKHARSLQNTRELLEDARRVLYRRKRKRASVLCTVIKHARRLAEHEICVRRCTTRAFSKKRKRAHVLCAVYIKHATLHWEKTREVLDEESCFITPYSTASSFPILFYKI